MGKGFEIENLKIRDEHKPVVGAVIVGAFVVAAMAAAALQGRGCGCSISTNVKRIN